MALYWPEQKVALQIDDDPLALPYDGPDDWTVIHTTVDQVADFDSFIAVTDKPAHTETAIKELGITYPQIINSQKIATDAYGIQAIPYSILFAPDGTILARGLRGEELEKKLAEIFKNK